MSNLYEASAQWANRPDDERFGSLSEMRAATKSYADHSREKMVAIDDLRVEADNGNLALVGKAGSHAAITNYAFGQLSYNAGAPAKYLRSLPATLAAQNINYGLKEAAKENPGKPLNLLFQHATDGSNRTTRAITSEKYDRVWNYEVIDAIARNLAANGWVVPPARPARSGQKGTRKATAADILPNQGDFGLAVKEGDDIAPAGLYASDHDMFAFLVNHNDPVFDGKKFLNRGVFVANSEVGDGSLWLKAFTYDNVCGNHIIWGVSKATEISVRHLKGASGGKTLRNFMGKWYVLSRELPTSDVMAAQIKAAQGKEIAGTKEEVLDAVFSFGKSRNLNALTRTAITGAYAIAEKTPRYGAPNTVWGLLNGLTEYSQTGSVHTDDRTALDIQAGRLMDMAF